ncbi:MAG: toprim domain-containing protein [Cytophagales bacterium]|nr:toprim domain-containing protein [Cytophagales bacterium]
MNIEQAKSIRLDEVLTRQGFEPLDVKKGGTEFWYISPFRQERTPSFSVDLNRNLWCDFGEVGGAEQKCAGGNVIAYVMRFYHTDVSGALEQLKTLFQGNISQKESSRNRSIKKKGNPMKLQLVKSIELPALHNFLNERKIPFSLAQKYLKQVHYKHEETFTTGYALGMRNDEDGYEIRNKYFKGLIGKRGITFVKGSNSNGNLQMIEGHYDFLSLLAIYQKEKPQSDAIILNGATMINEAVRLMKANDYQKVQTWFDNDLGGRQALDKLTGEFQKASISIKPQNHKYKGFNDINEMHRALSMPEISERFGL